MSACPACKAEGYFAGAPCKRCGSVATASIELELDVPKPPPPKPKAPPKKEEEIPLELAVDLNAVRSSPSLAPSARTSVPPSGHASYAPAAAASAASPRLTGPAPLAASRTPSGPPRSGPRFAQVPMESDDEIEARTLAGYGDAPTSALKAPFYAYKVHKRRQELARALVGRREDATSAQTRAEDALVAFGERARPILANDPESARTLMELKRAEELMRSRDHSLAREHDVHAERLRGIDQRIAAIEAELVAAQAAERQVSAELADAQASLQRVEARFKRAEIELRNQATAREKTRIGR